MIFLVIALFLLLAAFFDAAEIALVSTNRYRVKHLAEKGWPGAVALMKALSNPMLLPGTTLVGVNLSVVTASSVAALWALHHFGHWGPLWADLVLTPLTLVAAEILPKVYGRRRADAFALQAIPLLYGFYYLLYALTWTSTKGARAVLRALGVAGGSPRFLFSRSELEAVVSESERAGSVESEQGKILSSVFVFGETRVSEIMVPRTEVEAVEKTHTLRETLHEFRRNGFSRMPVYEESLDVVVGMVYLFDLFRSPDWDVPVESAMHPVLFTPEARKCDDLLKDMQMRHQHMAVVLDEYGGTAGIVSFEDLLEELVGEIADEHDEVERAVKAEPDGSYLLDGQARIEDVTELTGIQLPEGDYETLAGLLLDRLGRIPRARERVELPGFLLTVVSADRRRVKQVRLTPQAAPVREEE